MNSDDQGNSPFCLQFATAKVIVNGFLKKKFNLNKKIQFNQRETRSAIINAKKVDNRQLNK